MNELFFEKKKLRPSREARLIFPQDVLARGEGSCMGLSVLYLCVAEHVGLSVHGVLAPRHFFVRYDDGRWRRDIETMRAGSRYVHYERRTASCFYRNLSPRETLACLLVNRAAFLHAPANRLDLALKDCRRATKWFPEHPYAYLNQGIILLRLGRNKDAMKAVEMAVSLDPEIERDIPWLTYESAGAGTAEFS